MKHYFYKEQESYKVCFLVNKIQLYEIEKEYLSYLNINKEDILLLDLYKDPSRKRTKASDMKEYWKDVLDVIKEFNIIYLVICNGDYYKLITKCNNINNNIGYIIPVENVKTLYCPNFESIFYDPLKTRERIKRSLSAINDDLQGLYKAPGSLQIRAEYPYTNEAIKSALRALYERPSLTCDIETFSLRPHLAGLASITFCWNQEEGVAFQIDKSPDERNTYVRFLLRDFFRNYEGTLIFHNAAFDIMVLIYQLWMKDITDTEGLLNGMEHLLKNFEDTKLIAYLATNSCAGNELGLKSLAQEFAGNYAQEDIDDVTKIPLDQLLEYNLIDGLSTWYVYNKYKPKMIEDQQEEIYQKIFLPATKDIIQMQLTGFPLNMKRVLEVEQILQNDLDTAIKTLQESSLIKNYVDILNQRWVEERNSKLKKKRVTIEDASCEFNPRSHKQLQELLYEVMGLPIVSRTDSNLPSTDSSTVSALKNHTDNQEYLNILNALIDFAAVDKILVAFIPTFKEAIYSPWMNWHFLVGNFHLGGTVSGRLSSSKPNLQQLPATGSKYAKLIKSCFQAPEGWLLCGLDFNALEDHISALLTKDKNKLKVYTDHYDGHCLRAYSYFPEQMPDITSQLEEVHKEGKIYKVTLDSGEVKYFNENNPEFLRIKENAVNT